MLKINKFLDDLDSYQEIGAKALGIEHNFSIGGISMMQAVLGVATLGIGILISVVVYKFCEVKIGPLLTFLRGNFRFLKVQFHFDGSSCTDTRYYPVDIIQFDDDPVFSSTDNRIGRPYRFNGGSCA
tara:strand:+ start:1052 stop:1432 length:381 start_codon:yes stop_codon:yes gene_type:complete